MIASTVLPVESDRENKVEIVSIGRAVKPIDIQVIILRNIKVEINHPVLEQVLIKILRRKSKSVGSVALTYLGSLDEVGKIPALILGINQNMVVELIKVMDRLESVDIEGTDFLAGIGKISPRSNGKNLIAFPELNPGEVIIPEHPGKLVGNGSLAINGIITILHGIPFPGKIRSLGSLENPTTGFCSHGERIPIDKGKRKQRSKQIQFHRFSFSINSGHPFPPGKDSRKANHLITKLESLAGDPIAELLEEGRSRNLEEIADCIKDLAEPITDPLEEFDNTVIPMSCIITC
jgi:hypothetical protein